MKTVIAILTLGALIGPTMVLPASAQQIDPARARAIQECMAEQRRNSHDPYERKAGVMFTYQACMASRRQPF